MAAEHPHFTVFNITCVVVALVVFVATIIYVFVAKDKKWYPFTEYNRPPLEGGHDLTKTSLKSLYN